MIPEPGAGGGADERRRHPIDVNQIVRRVAARVEQEFRQGQIVKSFGEFLEDLYEHPRRHVRNAAQYIVDMLEYLGREPAPPTAGDVRWRYKVFDLPAADGRGRVHGQERAQAELVKYLRHFADKGRVDKLLMLHGPNGSGKSTTVECLIRGLEVYSRTPEGALYTFNWVFSDALERDRLGFGETSVARRTDTYAYLEPEEISARIPCELRDNPIFLLPEQERARVLREAFAYAGLAGTEPPTHALAGELCPKCREIYDTLLTVYQGDWNRVVQHVQVERFFISKRYRQGAITIEPQRNVDATARPLNPEARHQIPTVLRNTSLLEPVGDLIDANRGIVVYSDFFKRPLEAHKYLLTTIEQNTVSLPGLMAYLDVAMLATANEKNLCLFKRDPDFSSFKARFELIKVPYLLSFSQEEKIYREQLEAIGREKHVAPHTGFVTALWAVLTRLRRPRAKNYPGAVGNLVGRLSPLEKAYLYDRRRAPEQFTEQERRELLAHYDRIRSEYDDHEEEFEGILDAAYEGRRGASPREMLTLLADVAAYPEFPCLSPLAVFKGLRELVKDVSVYDFLRITPQAGYNDCPRFIDDVENEYLRLVEEEIQDAMELVPAEEYNRLFDDYFVHVRAFVRGEKVPHRQTGALERPDEELMRRVEETIGIRDEPSEFRRNLVTRIAAHSIENPGKRIEMRELFADLFKQLKAGFYRARDKQIDRTLHDFLRYQTEEWSLLDPPRQRRVEHMVERMTGSMGYCLACAKEAVAFVLKRRLA
ncbi:MAG: serine protein kinase [Planctomycetota bacterium]|nr:MAG: serine protein kinase [Planctomycetota bacterium]